MPATRRGASSPALAAQGAKVAQSPSTVATVSKAATTNNASLSAYEEARLKNIARNTEVLAGLGIATETSAIAVAATKQRTFAKPEKRARESLEPVRRSTRGKDADGNEYLAVDTVTYRQPFPRDGGHPLELSQKVTLLLGIKCKRISAAQAAYSMQVQHLVTNPRDKVTIMATNGSPSLRGLPRAELTWGKAARMIMASGARREVERHQERRRLQLRGELPGEEGSRAIAGGVKVDTRGYIPAQYHDHADARRQAIQDDYAKGLQKADRRRQRYKKCLAAQAPRRRG